MATDELNLVDQPQREREPPKTEALPPTSPPVSVEPFNPEREREQARGDLARGLLLLLSFAVGGVLLFIGMGRLEGSVLAQSIFPSLIALAGTALGFYFGSQSPSGAGRTPPTTPDGGGSSAGQTVVVQPPPVQPPPVQPPVQPPPEVPPVQPPPVQPPVQPPVEPPVQPPPVQPPVQPGENQPPNQPPAEGE